MSATFYICALVGGLLYYYFVLRRFNSLGFRLFSMFAFVTALFVYWLYRDSQMEKSLRANGRTVVGVILSKSKIQTAGKSTPDNAVAIATALRAYKTDTLLLSEYVSNAEWDGFKAGDSLPVLYDATRNKSYVKISWERMLRDQWVLYVVASAFFGIGLLCWYFLRHIKVGVDEQTGDEWLQKDGKILLDERKQPAAKAMKQANLLSKLLQIFGK